ncbi:helix-turn-helix domain-containing protein [Humidisolicoccus flavus]|uniref:helix-turn-helix domain-containing protein n=1 Tax=Humidisolicoccus flavus TaxID=3111414 RepID=UPI00324DEA2B
MTSSSALLHPIRMRIIQSFLAHGTLTTNQLHVALADVPIATLYRHVNVLEQHRLIEVAEEQQIRGASEKTFRLAPELTNPSADELDALSDDALISTFTVFTSGLINDFSEYVHAGAPNLHADRVSFAQAGFWASNDELDEFGRDLMAALEKLLANSQAPGRRRRVLSTVIMPREQRSSTDDSDLGARA